MGDAEIIKYVGPIKFQSYEVGKNIIERGKDLKTE
jgi:hypothetical protein